MRDANVVAHPLLSSSSHVLIASLHSAFLKALEKPLKMVNLNGPRDYGLCNQELSETVQCDYGTFREVAAALDK